MYVISFVKGSSLWNKVVKFSKRIINISFCETLFNLIGQLNWPTVWFSPLYKELSTDRSIQVATQYIGICWKKPLNGQVDGSQQMNYYWISQYYQKTENRYLVISGYLLKRAVNCRITIDDGLNWTHINILSAKIILMSRKLRNVLI